MSKNNIFQNSVPFYYLIIPILKYTKKIEEEFNNSFFITNNKNPYRQFFHTVPKQNKYEYSNYLYPSIESCKSSSFKCKPYTDIRIYNSKL